ncbi:metallophosphoesterase [Thalassotalea aquiviva]|uniref:metallophosphoesterase n=1 Tax=Thalassotalea aquiviva TaxID=3242415 RepID=UPI00352B679D
MQKIAQISDCHLYGNKGAIHHGQNVYQNLVNVFIYLSKVEDLSAIIFTGDLSQDHSVASYRLFQQAFANVCQQYALACPLYWLSGNHDDANLMQTELTHPNIYPDKSLTLGSWDIQLLDSTTSTPAGEVDIAKLSILPINLSQHQLWFMHHHPINMGYFIDRHGLLNQQQFWQHTRSVANLKAIGCGHVHRGQSMTSEINPRVSVFTCPATSIQFDPKIDGVAALEQGPGLRLMTLTTDGQINSELVYLPWQHYE